MLFLKSMLNEGNKLWQQVKEALQGMLSKATFEAWISPTNCAGFVAERLLLLAPNSFTCSWLRKNYLKTISCIASEMAGRSILVIVETNTQLSALSNKVAKPILQGTSRRPESDSENILQNESFLRVVELLKQDLSFKAPRMEGIALLESLCREHGTLESVNVYDLSGSKFQLFFKQIRQFLTIQEQVELFNRWGREGSRAAEFMSCVALTAQGFISRNPMQIVDARLRLKTSAEQGVDEVMGCQLMLLGGIKMRAINRYQNFFRNDLQVRILSGFRDIDGEPDLEGWFTNAAVKAFLTNSSSLIN